MDDEIQALERALERDPDDREAALRLKAALLRAGRRDELTQRFRLGFVCDVAWEDMRQTRPDGLVRHCERCARDVHAADSYADFDRLAAAGHCVAVIAPVLPRVLEGLVDAPGRAPLKTASDPCLVERRRPIAAPRPMRLAGAPMPVRPPPRG